MPCRNFTCRALSALLAFALAVYPALPVRAETCGEATTPECGCAMVQMQGQCCGCCARPVPAPERTSSTDLARVASPRANLTLEMAPAWVLGSSLSVSIDFNRCVAIIPAEGATLTAQGIRLQI